jgi:capsular polysaccharide biosynthesis protein
LVAAVDRTRIACEEADAAEKAALAARQASPAFILDEVQVVENVPPVDYGWRRLVITTLGTSVMMAVGFGAFTKGAEIDPTLANAAQLAADANVPILGVVPAADPIDATGKFNRQSRSRKALIALGFFLMCVSPFAAIWGVMGM